MSGGSPFVDALAITGGETLMLLAARPGDAGRACGGLVAELCRRGRPPFVMVLGDGAASDGEAAARAREARAAMAALGLEPERLLLVGVFEGRLRQDGPLFEAVVAAVVQVMWRMDCNLVAAPVGGDAAHVATAAIAAAVAASSGVGRLDYAMPDGPSDAPSDAPPASPCRRSG